MADLAAEHVTSRLRLLAVDLSDAVVLRDALIPYRGVRSWDKPLRESAITQHSSLAA